MYILENTWEKSKPEWLLGNERERQQTLEFIRQRLKMTQADGLCKLWKTKDDLPIALMGAFKVGPKKFETFLICSRHMEDHSIEVSFDMRRLLKEAALKYKDHRLGQYAEAHQTEMISWFRFLGFKYKEEGNIGQKKYYEIYAPNS